MLEQITNAIESLPVWLNAITALVTAASAVVALAPWPKGQSALDKALRVVRRVAELLAIDIGNAKPKDRDDE